jgi:hypothetical protein
LIEQSASRPKASALASELGVADGFEVGEAVDDQQVGPSVREPLRFVPGRRSSGGPWTDRFHACPARRIHRVRGVKRRQCPSHILGSGTLRWVTAILSQVSGVAGLGSVGAGVWSPGPTFLPNRTAPASARRSQRANRENRATHGPQDQAGRGPQRLAEAANTVAGRENTGGYELFPS